MPARRPKTLMSSSELVPSRFAPCTDTQATSPAAYRPGIDGVVVGERLALDVGRDAAHRVVRGREDRDHLGVGLDAEVGPRELGDVRQLRVDLLAAAGASGRGRRRRSSGPAAAALAHLVGHRAGDHVARREVLDRGGVALHEALVRRCCAGCRPRRARPRTAARRGRPGRSGGTGRTPCPPAAGPCATRCPCRRRSGCARWRWSGRPCRSRRSRR